MIVRGMVVYHEILPGLYLGPGNWDRMQVSKSPPYSKVERKGRVQIPAPVREYLKLGEGDILVWILGEGSGYEVRKGHLEVSKN